MRGSCLCGGVVFEVTPPLRPVVDCHCSQCRRQSGHFWAATSVPHTAFRLLRDEGLRWFRASPEAQRGFCGGCGAFLFWQPEGAARISFAAGALEGPTGLATAESWHHADAGDYYDPDGGPPPTAAGFADSLQGGCLCGANRFALPGPMGAVTACHCTQCRKTSGHYSASFDAEEGALNWQARDTAEHRAPGGGARGFCPGCGTQLYFRAAGGAFSVEAGAIANPTGGRLARHIFVADKGDYYGLADGLPQFPGAAP